MCASERGGSDDLIMFRQPKSFRYPIRPHPPLEVPLLFSPGMLRTATPAERVRLVVALSEAGSSLRCIAVSLDIRLVGSVGSAAYSLWLGTKCAFVVSTQLQR